jgi:DNA-binding response OmpR family regulator
MGKRILVVDDDVNIVEMIRDRLEKEKYDVIGAFDGEDGLEKAHTERPDLIITDIVMPKMNGHELAAKLHADPALQSIPVIVMTSHVDLISFFGPGEIKESLIKPFKIGDLVLLARQYVGEVTGKKILVIDDDPEVLRALEPVLRANRYAVSTAANGKEGLDKIKKEIPDAILVDMLMPVINGRSFLKILRSVTETSQVPVIIMGTQQETIPFILETDADEILLKPFNARDVLNELKSLLQRRVLVLCDEGLILEKINRVVRERGFEMHILKNEDEMKEILKKIRYKAVIAFLPCVQSAPEAFVLSIHTSKNKATPLIMYSSSKVKSTETDNIAVIRDIKRTWLKANADVFFDLRIAEDDLPVIFDKAVGIEVD